MAYTRCKTNPCLLCLTNPETYYLVSNQIAVNAVLINLLTNVNVRRALCMRISDFIAVVVHSVAYAWVTRST